MSVKKSDFTPQLISNTRQRASIFLRSVADRIVDVAQPTTPKKEGNLSRDIVKQVLGLHGRIEWRKVYAAYQERGRRADGTHIVRKYTTPGTKAHFAENAVKKVIADTPSIAKATQLI